MAAELDTLLFLAEADRDRPAGLRRRVQQKLKPLIEDPLILEDLLMALEEAFSNVLEHSQAGNPGQGDPIRVEVFMHPAGLGLQVTDYGARGGEWSPTQNTEAPGSEALRRKAVQTRRGLGLVLLKRTMDLLCYEVRRNGQNRLLLVRRWNREERMHQDLVIDLRSEGDLLRLQLQGYVNMDTCDFLADELDRFLAAEQPRRALILAADLEYASSAGLGIFLNLNDTLERRGGRVCFAGLNPGLVRALTHLGFKDSFGFAADEAEARAWLEGV